jgi:hypothetical protein
MSLWGSHVLFMEKKNSSKILIVDYRLFNELMILPNINNLFDQLKRANVFSKIDRISS